MTGVMTGTASERALRTPEEVHTYLDDLEGQLVKNGYEEKARFQVRLACNEALTNARVHGNQNDPHKVVKVFWAVGADQLWIEVEDKGEGFDPAKVPDPTQDDRLEKSSGRGLLIIRAYMQKVIFSSRGNVVRMSRERSWAPDIHREP